VHLISAATTAIVVVAVVFGQEHSHESLISTTTATVPHNNI